MLVGWGMLSAERYLIVLYGQLQLPSIVPHNVALYAWLRSLQTYLAYLLFLMFLAHFGAAPVHGLIRRDGVCWGVWRHGTARHRNEANASWDPHTRVPCQSLFRGCALVGNGIRGLGLCRRLSPASSVHRTL
jgi:hypothetical protein